MRNCLTCIHLETNLLTKKRRCLEGHEKEMDEFFNTRKPLTFVKPMICCDIDVKKVGDKKEETAPQTEVEKHLENKLKLNKNIYVSD